MRLVLVTRLYYNVVIVCGVDGMKQASVLADFCAISTRDKVVL